MGEPERRAEDPKAADPDELTLLERLRADPEAAIVEVVVRFERPLLRYARALLGNESAAQDVVQEAFLRLLRKTSSVRALSAWLGRVTHNLAVDHLRKEARRNRLHATASAELETAIPADREPTSREVGLTLERELARLGTNERAVIVLKVIEGKSYKEISALTGLSTSNVGYLIHHGLKKLAAGLASAGVWRGGAS